MIEIEKNVPLSSVEEKPTGILKHMEVGDSVFIKASEDAVICQRYCHNYGRYTGKKFKTKYVGGGIRIWRIK